MRGCGWRPSHFSARLAGLTKRNVACDYESWLILCEGPEEKYLKKKCSNLFLVKRNTYQKMKLQLLPVAYFNCPASASVWERKQCESRKASFSLSEMTGQLWSYVWEKAISAGWEKVEKLIEVRNLFFREICCLAKWNSEEAEALMKIAEENEEKRRNEMRLSVMKARLVWKLQPATGLAESLKMKWKRQQKKQWRRLEMAM